MPKSQPNREQGDTNISPERQKYWERNLTGETKHWFDEDCKYFLKQNLSTPVLNVIQKAYGPYIEDLNGKRYLDMHGNGVHNAGFNNPNVIEAVQKQMEDQMTFCPRRYTNIPAIQLAKKLAKITPGGLGKSLFAPGGSEAVEMAISLAKQITGNWKTISFWDSYHGTGFAAASVSGEELFHGGLGPLVPGAYHVEFPNYYRNPWNFKTEEEVDAECIRQMKILLEKEPDIACIIGEPISATPVVPSQNYWRQVKDLCEDHGALLIFDEIIEGFGRTGTMFASQQFVTPDVLVLGKSLGGGLVPFAGIVTHEKYDTLPHRSIGHYTHEKNALCSAAALAEIEYIEEHNLCEHAAKLGTYTLNRLNEMKENYEIIGNVAGKGLHIGIDLVKNRETKEKAVDEAERILFRSMERGLAFKTIEGSVITLRPSLVITQPQMDEALSILEESIAEEVSTK